ncbi:MAG: ABC transporter substrate-binding protein [Geitlerinemataceae cyanobacterium]
MLSFFARRRNRWLTAIAALFAALSIGVAIARQPVTISLLMQAPEASNWESIVEAFERENPDIRLNVVAGPNASNLVEDLYTSSFLLGSSPYDLAYMDIVWTPKFAAAGWLEDLSDRAAPAMLSEFLAGDVNGGRYDGGLYRIPFRSDAGMLYYRKDLLDAADREPPATFAELAEISQQLQGGGEVEWGYLWQGRQYEGLSAMFVEILAGFGGTWIDPETKAVGLDAPEAIAAIEFLQSTVTDGLTPEGVTTYQEEESRLLFQNGKTAFLRNWPYVWRLANDPESPIAGKLGIVPMPSVPGATGGACQGGWGLGLVKGTKHPEEAWRAIEFITSEAVQKQFSIDTGYVPSRTALFADPEILAEYPHYPQLLEVLGQSVLRPPVAQYAQASDILQRYLSAALTGRLDAETAMARAAGETRQLLDAG